MQTNYFFSKLINKVNFVYNFDDFRKRYLFLSEKTTQIVDDEIINTDACK